jgi:flagellar hook protein FlgE
VGTPQTLQYSNTGVLTAPAGGLLAFPPYTPTTGAAAMNVTVDLGQSTQFGGSFSVNSVTQDGYTTGRLIGIDIDETGIVQARFTNGKSQSLGQVAIANFANPQGLQQLGNTQWAETFSSGQALRGQAGNSGFGLVQSGALEGANVDVTEQLVQHDHRAAQLPGERADDQHGRPDHPDHHQISLTIRRGNESWTGCSTWR